MTWDDRLVSWPSGRVQRERGLSMTWVIHGGSEGSYP